MVLAGTLLDEKYSVLQTSKGRESGCLIFISITTSLQNFLFPWRIRTHKLGRYFSVQVFLSSQSTPCSQAQAQVHRARLGAAVGGGWRWHRQSHPQRYLQGQGFAGRQLALPRWHRLFCFPAVPVARVLWWHWVWHANSRRLALDWSGGRAWWVRCYCFNLCHKEKK